MLQNKQGENKQPFLEETFLYSNHKRISNAVKWIIDFFNKYWADNSNNKKNSSMIKPSGKIIPIYIK